MGCGQPGGLIGFSGRGLQEGIGEAAAGRHVTLDDGDDAAGPQCLGAGGSGPVASARTWSR
ncbi:hypothetical protein C3486_26940 [Streptomyces sp. Ru73]|nr:hypothetical protein C3486_26940 [Streptomyces sp. Ru73]